MTSPDYERLLTLLADRATQGLDEPEGIELKELLMKHPEWNESDLELTAAALCLAELDVSEPLPASLRTSVLATANRYFDPVAAGSPQVGQPAKVVAFPASRHLVSQAGWYVAAASLVLAAFLAWPRPTPVTPPTPSLADLRSQLLQQPDLLKTNWSATETPEARQINGDIVWSPGKQSGYMRFRGLPANNPTVSVYQLWIFDVNQDEKYPIDGGVFSVTREGDEVIIPITAKLFVSKPTLFALTVEKPGGVVVSKRDKLILVAKPPTT
ncbi:MAG: anti-sigma factor [Blastocatellia bacterium]|nr:anti-sigma factor [Blastocatellia bacterium]